MCYGETMARPKLTILSVMIIAVLTGGWFALSRTSYAVTTGLAETTAEPGMGPLDGMIFTGAVGQYGKPKDIPDTFVFANGMFLSQECEQRCKYPARPYFVRNNGNKTEFLSETKCPYKDAKIIWHGTIQGDTIKGVSTWVVKRWYWTIEKEFEFAGTLSPQSTPASATE